MNLSQIKHYFPVKSAFSGKILFVLLFLFPILSLSVRHWLSASFALLAFLSLFFAWRSKKPVQREEKILLAIFGFYFFSILLSSTVTGWSDSSYHRLGTELKYLVFIPFYLYIRQHPTAWRGLILTIPFGGIILGFQSIYDIYFTEVPYANGVYGPIILGDLAMLLGIFSLIFALTNKHKFWIGVNFLAVTLAMLAVVYSGSRNAWLASIAGLIILPFLIGSRTTFKRVSRVYITILTVATIIIISTPSSITSRAGMVAEEFKNYFQLDLTMSVDKMLTSSVGERLDMWSTAVDIIKENPLLGVGPGNMGLEINKLVDKWQASPTLYRKPDEVRGIHTHNAYLELMGTQGIIGLSALLLMLFYPLYVFVQNKHYDLRIASMGIVLMSGFIIFSLTETPFIHDNFSSIFITFLSVFFAWIMQAKYSPQSTGQP